MMEYINICCIAALEMSLCILEEHSFVGVRKSYLAERRYVHWQQMMVALATPFMQLEHKYSGRVHEFSKTPGDYIMLGLYPLLQLSSWVAPLLGHLGCSHKKWECWKTVNCWTICLHLCTLCGEKSRAALKAASGIFMHPLTWSLKYCSPGCMQDEAHCTRSILYCTVLAIEFKYSHQRYALLLPVIWVVCQIHSCS